MYNINYPELYAVLKPLTFYVIGITVYSMFVFKFYRFLSKKDLFELNLDQYNTTSHPILKKFISIVFYIIEYIFFFPVLVFFWFTILTIFLTFLSRDQAVQNILLVSIAIVGAVRLASYYNEDLSRDLAKMLPFALLGLFLIDISYFSFGESYSIIWEIPTYWKTLLYI